MLDLMHVTRLKIPSDLHEETLMEAVCILSKDGDEPLALLCSRKDYFVAQKISEKCGVPRYSYIPDELGLDIDAWMLVGNKLLVYSSGA